jgi:hypothetical protein
MSAWMMFSSCFNWMLNAGLSVWVISVRRASSRAFRVRSTIPRSSSLSLKITYPTSFSATSAFFSQKPMSISRFTVEAERRSTPRLTQAHRALYDGVEDRLDVGRRARNHSQDLGHGGLLLERFAERAPQSLELGLQVCMG